MPSMQDIIAGMRANPGNVRFADLRRVCEAYFGKPRVHGSHHVYPMPWPGDPRVNVQEDKGGRAKGYQVRQVLAAIERMEGGDEPL